MENRLKYEPDPSAKIEQIQALIAAREEYTRLLRKKRPLLLTMALVFCIFYGISLFICLPPYIIRGQKMDINQRRIQNLKTQLYQLMGEVSYSNMYPNAQGYNPNGYPNAQGYNPNGYPNAQGYNPNGYPNAQGYNPNGYPNDQDYNPNQQQ